MRQALLLIDIIVKATPAFSVTEIRLDIPLDRDTLELPADGQVDDSMISGIDFGGVVKKALRVAFPEVTKRKDKKSLYKLISSGAEFVVMQKVLDDPDLIGDQPLSIWLKADDSDSGLFGSA